MFTLAWSALFGIISPCFSISKPSCQAYVLHLYKKCQCQSIACPYIDTISKNVRFRAMKTFGHRFRNPTTNYSLKNRPLNKLDLPSPSLFRIRAFKTECRSSRVLVVCQELTDISIYCVGNSENCVKELWY